MILQFRMTGPRLCELDSFRGVDRIEPRIPGALCSLRRFELISEEQAKQLRTTLARRQQTPAVVRTSTTEPADE
jgi:hypothetical protein